MRRTLLTVLVMLFAVGGCASAPSGKPADVWSHNTCSADAGCPPPPAPANLSGLAGPSGKVSLRGLLVERDDRVYPLILYLVEQPDGGKVLVDPIGQTYSGLGDFREHNTLLTPQDKVSAPGDIMTADSAGTIDTTGHVDPPAPWWPWPVAGIAALLIIALVVWRTLSRRRRVRPC